MNRVIVMSLLLAAVVTWTLETMNREKLTKRLDQARLTTRFASRVKAEHEDLLRRQPFSGEVETLRRDRAELMSLRREMARRELAADETKAGLEAVGREILPFALWLPTLAMKDLGRLTPHATIQTLVWAAGVGQVPALKELLTFEAAVRQEADQLLSRLPPAGRPISPEFLMAQVLIQHPPKGEIQIMAELLKGFDEAAEFLVWRKPDGATHPLYFRLRWEPGGWRIVVPLQVLENAVRTGAGEPGLPSPELLRELPQLPEP